MQKENTGTNMMADHSANNRRIAKNTLMLYVRMLVLMLIGFYTSRVILQALGVEDYGINSVVAGFLSMFGIITSSMSGAISRFITVELGKGDLVRLKQVFSTSITVQLVMGILILVLVETFGIWFVRTKMQIPLGREVAAEWCLHCAALSTFISLINVPFSSAIIAHEKMSAFAYMTIIDALLKLGICYMLYISPIDKLITYAILGVFVTILTTSIYWIYCLKKFDETTISIKFDSILFKEIWGFAGWNLFAQTAWILNTQGINMLMNVFFGVVVNAARGVAGQVNGVIQGFVNNFMVALNPQITKYYAVGDKEAAFKLACRGSRFSFYIMFVLALPIMIESHQILKLWLVTPPEQADVFVVWTILSTLATLLGNTLVTLQMAHGNIRHYQLWITFFGCLPFPLTWVVFRMGASPVVSYYIFVAVYWGLIFVRYYLVHGMTGIPAKMYLVGVVAKTHVVAAISAIIPLAVFLLMDESILRLLIIGVTSILSSCLVIYFIGLDQGEKRFIREKYSQYASKITVTV
ncbi:MAG: MATE family efflux transporter [Candidatus Cryptobacteroides sp.]